LRKTGHFQQAFFKVATGGKMGVICNCCKKCCGGGLTSNFAKAFIDANRRAVTAAKKGLGDPLKGVGISAPSGYSVRRDAAKCKLCGTCAKICNFDAIEIRDDNYFWDEARCMGCGLCEEHCPNHALEMYLEEDRGYLPLDLDLAGKVLKKN
jgi:Pyruvate/2-oxoacid:ferredoxin oxidoreductase delta subunit